MKKLFTKKKIILFVAILLLLLLVLPMGITIIAYEMNFGMRIDGDLTPAQYTFEEFSNLSREPVEFSSNQGQTLRGYVYSSSEMQEPKALIVLSHGYLGIHEDYLPQINYFVQNGFLVLGFDNTGCGRSDGKNMIGLAQSPFDLDAALTYVENAENLKNYPILLYGHSWGGYAVSAVLNYNHKVTAVVSRSGFNNSRDMLVEYGSRLYGNFISLLSPFAYLYEKIKFGGAVDENGVKGIKSTSADVLLLHSKDDETISLKNSLLIHKDEFGDNVKTILYDNKTHDVVKSDASIAYHKELDTKMDELIQEYGSENKIPNDVLTNYYANIDKNLYNELDENVMQTIVDFYNQALEK